MENPLVNLALQLGGIFTNVYSRFMKHELTTMELTISTVMCGKAVWTGRKTYCGLTCLDR